MVTASPNAELWTLDSRFLDHAIRLGARGLGRTAENPSVGCVIVQGGQIVAAARTADGGRPHAEALALGAAGARAHGATAYVSLEPCAHYGQTPPCADALIKAGVARVVIAAIDPDPRVSRSGIAMLRAAGIAAEVRDQRLEARHYSSLNSELCPLTSSLRGFFRRVTHGLPYVAMKLAISADGFLAAENHQPRWITGEAARTHGHRIRSTVDTIVTGIGTVLADDPLLTVRLPGLAHSKLLRVVCDRRLRLPLTCKLLRTAEMQPVAVITTARAVEEAASHATELRQAGVILHVVEDEALSPRTILSTLAANGSSRVLVEAGAELSEAFLSAKCVDTLYCYRAPNPLGNTGIHPVPALKTVLSQAAPAVVTMLGDDRLEQYELRSTLE